MPRLAFFLVALTLTLGACKRASQPAAPPLPSPIVAPTIAPSATPEPTKRSAFDQVSTARSAVVVVSVFDASGALVANTHGFFVSDDGKIVADRSALAAGANGVAKAAQGSIYNIAGMLARSEEKNLALLQADAKNVPYLTPGPNGLPEIGEHVAVVLSPVERTKTPTLQETVTARLRDAAGDWIDVTPALPRNAAGAPVIDQRGQLVGIVVLREGEICCIRPASIARELLQQARSNTTPAWQEATPTPSATPTPIASPKPSPSPTRSPNPVRIAVRGTRIIYAPPPRYPADARRIGASGVGTYRIVFDSTGRVTSVSVIRSSGWSSLDSSALGTLRSWRGQPGSPAVVTVPITFRP
ncbi:MAG: TonB family protein [Verrucomicrobiota bacterium]|nr:TonB family protein [Verrucomicrobiota bacterium]